MMIMESQKYWFPLTFITDIHVMSLRVPPLYGRETKALRTGPTTLLNRKVVGP